MPQCGLCAGLLEAQRNAPLISCGVPMLRGVAPPAVESVHAIGGASIGGGGTSASVPPASILVVDVLPVAAWVGSLHGASDCLHLVKLPRVVLSCTFDRSRPGDAFRSADVGLVAASKEGRRCPEWPLLLLVWPVGQERDRLGEFGDCNIRSTSGGATQRCVPMGPI